MIPLPRRAAVVGGGVAGIAAAGALARAGVATVLVERRHSLGGRASSFRDPVSGLVVDNGQHVVLGACTELLDLLAALGKADAIAWRDEYHFWCAGPGEGTRAAFEPARGWPARLRYLPSLLRVPYLSLGERLAILRGLAAAARLGEDELSRLEDASFEEWLRARGQPARAIDRFWSPVAVAALNEDPGRMSARAALWVFRRGFLGSPADARLGIPKEPLAALFDAPARDWLARLGVELALGWEADEVEAEAGRVCGVRAGSKRLAAEAVVLAVPWNTLARLAPAAARAADPSIDAASALEPSPIVGGHFLFPPGVSVPGGVVALLGARAQFVFDRHAASGREEDRGHLVAVVSAARDLARRPRATIERELLEDLRAAVPSARAAEPRRALVVTEWHATYAALPGAERLRPAVKTRFSGLFLAGDACDTGWPATLEGAVRSGRAAAEAVLASFRAG